MTGDSWSVTLEAFTDHLRKRTLRTADVEGVIAEGLTSLPVRRLRSDRVTERPQGLRVRPPGDTAYAVR